jgi:hypothetical protein
MSRGEHLTDEDLPTFEQHAERLTRQQKIREAKREKVRLGQIPELSVAELDQILGDTEGGASKWRRMILQDPTKTHRSAMRFKHNVMVP